MASKKKNTSKSGLISTNQTVADNRRAGFEYALEDRYVAGLVLVGTEVKSLRLGQCSLQEAYIGPKEDALYLLNAHIPEYMQAGHHLQHEPKRPRKLLLHKRESNKLLGAVQREGYTIIPIKLYFDDKGRAKLELAIGKGKKLHDKRETEKKRDWQKQKSRIMREH